MIRYSGEELGRIGDLYKAAAKSGVIKGNWLQAANEAAKQGERQGQTVDEICKALTTQAERRFTPQAVAKQFAEEFEAMHAKTAAGFKAIASTVYQRRADHAKQDTNNGVATFPNWYDDEF